MPPVKTRTGYAKHEPYPLNQVPRAVVEKIARQLVYWKTVGHADIGGDDFAHIFAKSIGGKALGSPLGIADVIWNGCCWSVKTVQDVHPHALEVGAKNSRRAKTVRLIAGRNSPVYSAGVTDPFSDVQATGGIVLEIYNSRVNEAKEHHKDVRMVVFVRNMRTQKFTIFERAVVPFAINNYQWKLNRNDNFEGREGNRHAFSWQPHGSQFTILEPLPRSPMRFSIAHSPEVLRMDDILRAVNYQPDWVEYI